MVSHHEADWGLHDGSIHLLVELALEEKACIMQVELLTKEVYH